MSDAAGFRFDVFLSYAREDAQDVRALAQQLKAAGLMVWFDEERISPGLEPQRAIVPGLKQSRHVLAWVTQAWQQKSWTRWEVSLSEASHQESRKVIPVLRVPWNEQQMGPYLSRRSAVLEECNEHERLWLIMCGVREWEPGERASWERRGRELATGTRSSSYAPLPGSTAARLEAALRKRRDLVTSPDTPTAEIDEEILKLRRELRRGPTLEVGEFLGDIRFRLVEVVGDGGFATVWKAYDLQAHQFVAIKVLHGQLARDATRREQLFRGVAKMADLQHPHVVRVILPQAEEQGFYYFVMEHVAGGNLHRAVEEGRLDSARALDVVESIAGALEAAHERGLVHGDVKPQNILLHENGTPSLTDLDLMRANDATGGSPAGAIGTVVYAAPEQSEDARVADQRGDVYSLGMTAVFCVYGRQLPRAALFDRTTFLSELRCEDVLRGVLLRAVALRSEDRFESMTSFRRALARARRGSTPASVSVVRAPEASGSIAVPPVSRRVGDDAVPETRRRWFLGGITAVAGLAATSGWLWHRQGSSSALAFEPPPREEPEAVPEPDDPTGAGTTSSLAAGVGNHASPGSLADLEEPEEQVEPEYPANPPRDPDVIEAPRGGAELVRIPEGAFFMGDGNEDLRHRVLLASFFLARTPVTNAQYARFLEANPRAPKPLHWRDPRYNQPPQPVVGISWHEAKAYCDWAGLVLPTEAQWEYACRAGTTTRYWAGNRESDLERVAWYLVNSGDRPHPVAQKQANEHGLHDVHGNVWEWCLDIHGSYRTPPRPSDGLRHPPDGPGSRILRGGSFHHGAESARSGFRNSHRPEQRDRYRGFRPALLLG